jgi:hypothetical protein
MHNWWREKVNDQGEVEKLRDRVVQRIVRENWRPKPSYFGPKKMPDAISIGIRHLRAFGDGEVAPVR